MSNLNIVVIGTGMFATGRGTTGFGTVLPAISEWQRLEKNIGKVKINLKYNSNVHAKILFTYSDQLQSGLIGSANLTDRSLKNDEIGVYIPKTEKTRKLVKDMQVSAMNIYHNSR